MNLVSDLLEHFGGHPEAGGFSIAIEKIPLLEEKLIQVADEWLKEQPASESPKTSIISLHPEQMTEKIYQELLLFEPFGQGNPIPLLSIKEAGITGLRFLGDGSHLRFSIQKASAKIKGLVWNRAGEFNDLLSKKSKIDLWGNLEENFFNGITTLQFVVNKFS
jgi:single-stranded-DNA-specific exonuclease